MVNDISTMPESTTVDGLLGWALPEALLPGGQHSRGYDTAAEHDGLATPPSTTLPIPDAEHKQERRPVRIKKPKVKYPASQYDLDSVRTKSRRSNRRSQ